MFEELRERAFRANMELWKRGVVIYTWGNVSEADRRRACSPSSRAACRMKA